MEQRISLVTIGVADLPAARAFYERLGWHGEEVQETMFFQAGPIVVVLWSADKLAADCGRPPRREAAAFDGIALAHNVRSREEVDELLATARDAGATITRPAAETFYGGYAGVFADLDGHVWEVAHNPGFELRDDGSIVLPDFSG